MLSPTGIQALNQACRPSSLDSGFLSILTWQHLGLRSRPVWLRKRAAHLEKGESTETDKGDSRAWEEQNFSICFIEVNSVLILPLHLTVIINGSVTWPLIWNLHKTSAFGRTKDGSAQKGWGELQTKVMPGWTLMAEWSSPGGEFGNCAVDTEAV